MKIYSPICLKKLRKLCDKYDVHLIADEIAVGIGRTGKMFACNHAEISPDFMCLSKGISAGYMPMSVVMTTEDIYDCFLWRLQGKMKTFIHSHTYSGNAMGCAIALENLKIFEEDDIIKNNIEKGRLIRNLTLEKAQSLKSHVGEVKKSFRDDNSYRNNERIREQKESYSFELKSGIRNL